MTFKQLISRFNQDQRAYSVLFELSNIVKNPEDYIRLSLEKIDIDPEEFERLIKSQIPIERINCRVKFWNREFILNPEVFCPRYETELVVQAILDEPNIKGNYIDLCSGSGVIGITVGLERPELSIALLDIDFKAIKNIETNVNRFKLNSQIFLGDWFNHLSKNHEVYKIISANFPYIGSQDQIDSEILNNEPKLALFSGCKDGWSHYQRLLNWMFTDKNWELVVLECNSNHQGLWDSVVKNKPANWNIELLRDEAGLLRVAKIKN